MARRKAGFKLPSMNIEYKVLIGALPVLLAIIGWLIVQLFTRINTSVKDVKSDVKDFRENVTKEMSSLRSDIGNALNNTGILTEDIKNNELT
jgi:hypothetical protein